MAGPLCRASAGWGQRNGSHPLLMHTDLERKHQTLPQQPSTAEEVPLKLFLLRHGETEWNQTGRFQGITDVPLDPAGRRQADALSLSLRDEPLCAVYASPLSRARETAERVARPHGLAVQTVADLSTVDDSSAAALFAA